MTNEAPRYVARKIRDPRSRGACYWHEIERVHADGRRDYVATAESRDEARDILRRLRGEAGGRSAG